MFEGNAKRCGVVAVAGLLLLLANSGLGAANLYKWVDSDGNITYQDEPPPSDVDYEKQVFSEPVSALESEVSAAIEEAARLNPVSLYTIPACEVCDLVRLYLEKNTIPFVEKNVQSSVALQQELDEKTGQLSVPTLLVGDEVLDGYSKNAIKKTLAEKGYPMDRIDSQKQPAKVDGDQTSAENAAVDTTRNAD